MLFPFIVPFDMRMSDSFMVWIQESCSKDAAYCVRSP
jgi:hypothetical protein